MTRSEKLMVEIEAVELSMRRQLTLRGFESLEHELFKLQHALEQELSRTSLLFERGVINVP